MGRDKTIALLGQPNSGKSTLYNTLTGSHQHVGNWPGKTVEQSIGTFKYNGAVYTVVDLPGTYSLAANSQEEIVTRDYIAGGEADLVVIMADASQLERSMFMLADYAGISTPAVMLLNMMDVADAQGKTIDAEAIGRQTGIPVIPFVAADRKNYEPFYDLIEGDGGTVNDAGLSELYAKNFGDSWNKITSVLPEDGISVFSRGWLFAKLMEKDPEVQKLVEQTIGADAYASIKKETDAEESGASLTGNCKFSWIDELIAGSVNSENKADMLSRFDRIAISKRWGKWVAAGVIIAGLIAAMIVAAPIMGGGGYLPMLAVPVSEWLLGLGVAPALVSLLCDGIWTAFSFTVMMCGFVFGTSFVFGLVEEVGYMARISYVFDGTMRKLGLHGKAVMPFLVSFGCNIAGATGVRVLDTWSQRMTAIAMSWVVPCGSTWGVVGLVSMVFFGPGALLVIIALFAVSVLHLRITARVVGKRLLTDADKTGLIMELPPYHKPRWGALLRVSLTKMWQTFKRAIRVVTVAMVILWALSYTKTGDIDGSIIYRFGTAIEPVTLFFGLRWETFIAWLASMFGKEGALGVMAAIFSNAGVLTAISHSSFEAADSSAVGVMLGSVLTKPEALAFIFAFYFNIPCIMALSATVHETRSLKWTMIVAAYYLAISLLIACVVYHIAMLIW